MGMEFLSVFFLCDGCTLNHVFASLAGGGPTEDMLLETVSLDRLGRLGLRQRL